MARSSASTCPNRPRRNNAPFILLVDDDEDFRNGLAEHLRDDGFLVRECSVPEQLPPLATLRDVSLLITDYELPGDDGLRFSDRFHGTYPQVPIVMVTSYRTLHLEAATRQRHFIHLLPKPLEYAQLLALLDSLEAGADRSLEVPPPTRQ